MKYSKILFLFLLLILTSGLIPLYGQVGLSKLGQSTMDFLLVSVSPKASAMGEAYTTIGTGAESMFYNPAGLAESRKTFDITIDYTQWIADIKYLAGGLAYNMGNYGSVGLNFITVNYGQIIGTRLDPNAGSALGYIETGDVSGVNAYVVGLTYAKAISTKFIIGGTMKIAGQNLGNQTFDDGTSVNNNAFKLAFDAGVKYYTGYKNFCFAMSIRNFASNIKREEVSEQLPLTFTMGGAISLMDILDPNLSKDQDVTLAADFLHTNSYSERVNMGVEYTYNKMVSLRAGYQTNRDVMSWSAGVGLNTSIAGSDVQVNYSFSKMDIFSDVSRLSAEFEF